MFRSDARDLGRTCVRDDHVRKSVSDGLQTSRELFSRFQDPLSLNSITRESESERITTSAVLQLHYSAFATSRSRKFTKSERKESLPR